MTAYASYYSREGVLQSEYDYSRASGAICYDAVNRPNGYFVCDSVGRSAGTSLNGSASRLAAVATAGGSGHAALGQSDHHDKRSQPFDLICKTRHGTFAAPTSVQCSRQLTTTDL